MLDAEQKHSGFMENQSVLGLDAAWTERGTSGVALVRKEGGFWRCVAVAPSYWSFTRLAAGEAVDWSFCGESQAAVDPLKLLLAAGRLLGKVGADGAVTDAVTVIAIDMPIGTVPIVGRRNSDNRISSAFGKIGCSTHSPSLLRPGKHGLALSSGFERAGYRIATADVPVSTPKCQFEVYPHPALVKLMNAEYRIGYKISKSARLWPDTSVELRIEKLLDQYRAIVRRLGQEMEGIDLLIPESAGDLTLCSLKRYEDCIDALVCAWVGIQYLCGKAIAYGDHESAIWLP